MFVGESGRGVGVVGKTEGGLISKGLCMHACLLGGSLHATVHVRVCLCVKNEVRRGIASRSVKYKEDHYIN